MPTLTAATFTVTARAEGPIEIYGAMVPMVFTVTSQSDFPVRLLRLEAAAGALPNLQAIVRTMRSGAKAEVLVSDGRPFVDIMRDSSRDAGLIFLGMRVPDEEFLAYYGRMRAAVKDMPTAAFVLAAEDMPFGEIVVNQGE